MSKIQDTLNLIRAGARNNKYRVMYPILGEQLDIACNATTNPGRELGTVDVFIKGRKVQYAAEENSSGNWEITMYNDPTLQHRNFFLEMINMIHSFAEPVYLSSTGDVPDADIISRELVLSENSPKNFSGWSSLNSFVSKIENTVSAINSAYNSIVDTYTQYKKTSNSIQSFVSGDITGLQEIFNINGYTRPWYMTDIVVEQLDHNGFTVSRTILHNAFVSQVGPIEYTDEVGDVSTTTVTFTYSGISYQ